MPITTLSSRDVNQDLGRAKRAAKNGPVVITDRGRPAHVLLAYEDYEKLLGAAPSIREALALPGVEDVPFDPPRLNSILKPSDLD